MKVLQINKYHYIRGGSDSVYLNTSKLLQEKGHEVVHFAMKYPENIETDEDVFFAENKDFVTEPLLTKIKNAPSFFYNRDAVVKLEQLVKAEKPDVAHLHIFYGSLTSSILEVLKKNNVPCVVTVHDYKFVCPAYLFLDGKNQVCEKCEGHNYYNAVVNKCVKGSYLFSSMFALESYYRDKFYPLNKMFKRIIFVSKFSEAIHVKYKPELNLIARHLYNFDPVISHKNFNNKKGDYFLYAGRLSKEKGLKTLIKAFSQLPDLKLKVAGTGNDLQQLKELATSNIDFLGFKGGDELQELIAGASFIIVPSEWYENNPMAIIEAYALGKPVIGAAIGGIPEIVNDSVTGFLFPSGNDVKLKQTIIKANMLTLEEYAGYSAEAKLFADNNFHPDVHYKNLLKIYEEVTQ